MKKPRLPPRLPIALLAVCSFAPALVAQAPPAKVAAAGREPALVLGGLLQIQSEFGDSGDSRFAGTNDRFYLRRARLNATGRFLEEFDFRLEVELAGSLAKSTAARAQLTDAFVNWNRLAAANVRVGQFKTPFGFEQLYADPKLPSIERSLANDRLTLSRQVGLQVSGDLFDKRLTYAAGAFNGNGTNNNFNDNNHFAWVGRLTAEAWHGRLLGVASNAHLGLSGYASEDTALALADLGLDSTPATADRDGLFTGKRTGFGADAEFVAGPLEVWAELLQADFEPASRVPAPRFTASGLMVQATCFVWQDRLQVLLRHESFDPSDRARRDVTATSTLGLNYFLKAHDLKLMVDALRVAIDGKPDQTRVLARLQVIL